MNQEQPPKKTTSYEPSTSKRRPTDESVERPLPKVTTPSPEVVTKYNVHVSRRGPDQRAVIPVEASSFAEAAAKAEIAAKEFHYAYHWEASGPPGSLDVTVDRIRVVE